MPGAFDPNQQQTDLASKVAAGLERISEAYKALLWEKAKTLGLSPIQIQTLLFVAYHDEALCNVSHLAREFNVTKPTISDAVRVLDKKGLIEKDHSTTDSRSYSISLSSEGEHIVEQTNTLAAPITSELAQLDNAALESLHTSITQLIFGLHRTGVLDVQRTCYACRFYDKTSNGHYCNLLQSPLTASQIRIDCPEFEGK